MADPTTTAGTAALLATGLVTVTGTALGIPADAIGASVIGAALALGVADRVRITLMSSVRVLKAFFLSLACGIFLGPPVALWLDYAFQRLTGLDLPDAMVRAAACLLVALGAQRLLPLVFDLLARVLSARAGGSQDEKP